MLICVYICIYMYIYMFICIYVYMYKCIHFYIHMCVFIQSSLFASENLSVHWLNQLNLPNSHWQHVNCNGIDPLSS